MLNVSVGFTIAETQIPWGTPFLAPIAERVGREAGLPVAASWGIDNPVTANQVVEDGQMDLVMVGRAHLANPHWPYAVAQQLKKEKPSWVLPAPYAHWLEKYRPN